MGINNALSVKRLENDDYIVHYPCDLRPQAIRDNFVKTDECGKPENPDEVPVIVRLGKSQAILDMLMSGTYSSRKEVGDALQMTPSTVTRVLNFAMVSPEIIERFMAGEIPASKVIAVADHVKTMPFWADQHKFAGVV